MPGREPSVESAKDVLSEAPGDWSDPDPKACAAARRPAAARHRLRRPQPTPRVVWRRFFRRGGLGVSDAGRPGRRRRPIRFPLPLWERVRVRGEPPPLPNRAPPAPLIRPALRAGHLLPQGEKGRAPIPEDDPGSSLRCGRDDVRLHDSQSLEFSGSRPISDTSSARCFERRRLEAMRAPAPTGRKSP